MLNNSYPRTIKLTFSFAPRRHQQSGGGQNEFEAALQAGFDLEIPEMGRVATSNSSNAYPLGLQNNQYFLVYEASKPESAMDRLKSTSYITDQSDGWGMLLVSG